MSDAANNLPSTIDTIEIVNQSAPEIGLWTPEVGQETLSLLQHLDFSDDESRETIRDQALGVLSRCVPPGETQGSRTGLVVGYVQSGKTMSFTTVTALARDNAFPMVIVIAGISKPLLKQSEKRLKDDLRLLLREDRQWKHFSNPKMTVRQSIESTLAEWADPSISTAGRQTVLITVMKNYIHLRNLNKLLTAINLQNMPVLVVDDEADQAGLNTSVKKGEQSTTYRQLVELRQRLPHHTFIQYTATPQAPLLINIIDVLSPNFAEVLTPGKDYTGGKEFFASNLGLVRTIPDDDIPSEDNPFVEPPESLLFAMMLFYLGVASAYVASEQPKGNRSMMVHPSQKTIPHAEYTNWVKQTRIQWLDILQLDSQDPDCLDLLEEFSEAYQDLKNTIADLPPFGSLADKLQRAIRITNIIEVNSKQAEGTPQVDWKNDYAHILVGGQAMDRGFTVEGLTLTYMPRGMGVGNADTVQQRARFFGYKKAYLGYCRVFVEDAVRDAFKAYVKHEEDIRARLIEHQKTMKPLSEWKRAFFLDKRLKPTRASVLDMPYIKDNYSDEWFIQTAPHDSVEAIQSNRSIIQQFLSELTLIPDEGHPDRKEMQKHLIDKNVQMDHVFDKLLLQLRMTRSNDSQYFTGLMLQVQRYKEDNPNMTCSIYQMSAGKERERSVNSQDKLRNLFQGAYPNKSGKIYPGDRYIREEDQLTIQIHNLTVKTSEGDYKDVPAIAIWVPASMSNAWLAQNQGTSLRYSTC